MQTETQTENASTESALLQERSAQLVDVRSRQEDVAEQLRRARSHRRQMAVTGGTKQETAALALEIAELESQMAGFREVVPLLEREIAELEARAVEQEEVAAAEERKRVEATAVTQLEQMTACFEKWVDEQFTPQFDEFRNTLARLGGGITYITLPFGTPAGTSIRGPATVAAAAKHHTRTLWLAEIVALIRDGGRA